MYKFLVCQQGKEEQHWFLLICKNMNRSWRADVKEAVLIGYFSEKQNNWITHKIPLHVRSNYQKVRQAFSASELTFIMLRYDLTEVSGFVYDYY